MAQHTNRLNREKSPYLLQHAHNPVDWYPWGDEAFAKARAENKPIFLSIGYSTCHWCHVMERESFENEEVASFLNEHFVSIKVDREERPDVDAIYMTAVQALSGSGGWPMSVFLAPDLKPFYAGTYFPPRPAYGRPSFLQLVQRIAELWRTERAALGESADKIMEVIRSADEEKVSEESAKIDRTLFTSTYLYFERTFDEVEGGFGGAPKFPRPVQFDLLFHYFAATGEERARDMALFTLRKMALGGMHDHMGGGFHRYSVDPYWRVSHFEKMLYDQAQLVESYLDAYQITGEEFYAGVARDILDYVLRDMTHTSGGFYSAEDADSEGEEGKFYAWTLQEIEDALGPDAKAFAAYYGITREGNFEHGKNVLHVSATLPEVAESEGVSASELAAKLARSMDKLFQIRGRRVRPHLDDKILTSWNGLMIGAFARAGALLQEKKYTLAAQRAAEFIWSELRKDGRLLHRWRDGEARFDAYLDDFASLVKGYLELYESTFESVWLARARELQRDQDEALWDDSSAGYFMSRPSADVLVRTKGDYDGAEPAGNSIAAHNLFRLAVLTEDEACRARAEQVVRYFVLRVARHPYAMPEMIAAAVWMIEAPTQIVFSGVANIAEDPLVTTARKSYLPVSVQMSAESAAGAFARSLEPKSPGVATAYVCHNLTCELPVTTAAELQTLLRQRTPSA